MRTIILPKDKIEYEAACVALGNFDGVHKGHRSVIEKCKLLAKEKGLISAVYTFLNHHRTYFGTFNEVITDWSAKKQVIEALLNPDYLLFQEIEPAFLEQTPREFVKSVLKDSLKAKCVVVGSHYTFGSKGMGDAALLKKLCEECGIETVVLPLVFHENSVFSSTSIRTEIKNGDVERANADLGYTFFVEGKIVHGKHIGAAMGFPTINILPKTHQLLPCFGVYATVTEIENKTYYGITNVGVKPTVGVNAPVIETNLFGVSSDLYGKTAKVSFIKQIRKEKLFSGLDELKMQIKKDSESVKKLFDL